MIYPACKLILREYRIPLTGRKMMRKRRRKRRRQGCRANHRIAMAVDTTISL